jgi:hypothetical protein
MYVSGGYYELFNMFADTAYLIVCRWHAHSIDDYDERLLTPAAVVVGDVCAQQHKRTTGSRPSSVDSATSDLSSLDLASQTSSSVAGSGLSVAQSNW